VSARRRNERGSVLVTFALALPLMLVIVSLVVNGGHWFTHHRHLQLQADAGALAGADLFNKCFESADTAAANTAITNEARKYAGDPTITPRYNSQVSIRKTENVVMRINRKTYDRGGPPADDTIEHDPCTAAMVDVKLSDEDVPWFLRLATVDAINAHARVQARVITALKGSLPIAIPDPEPKVASVTFINEGGGSAPCSPCTYALTGPTISGGVANFTMSGTAALTVAAGQNIGVRVNLGGETSTTCGDAFVECYDTGSANGLAMIRGYAASGGTPPVPRAVWPTTGSCSNVVSKPGAAFFYGVPYSAPCSVGISAVIDWGSLSNPSAAPPAGVLAQLTATFSGQTAGGTSFSASQAMSFSGGVWTTTGNVSLPAQAGPIAVSLDWAQHAGTWGGNTCTTTGGNKCKGTFSDVQRVFSAQRARSGPIKVVTVTEPSSSATGSPLSLAPGTHNVKVSIGTQYLEVASVTDRSTDETFGLRVADPSGSQNQAFDCDSDVGQWRLEIQNGCHTTYGPNPNHPGCPEVTPPSPPDCMNVETGDKVGQLEQGMDNRLGKGGSCSVNNWPVVPDGDVRAIPLIITQFGAFKGAGGSINSQVPVRRFGYFYVTGWSGSTCSTNEPYPWSPRNTDDKGDIWGHFIHHVISINNVPSGGTCVLDASADPLDLNPCVAVMTR
jgi:Putative Flp pilus-assembly TadE/G-like